MTTRRGLVESRSSGGEVNDPERDEARFARLMAVNLADVATAVQAAARVMGEGGHIISVGSWFASRVGIPMLP
jgi:NAD(P)-dependent dehydrogenase (short-subunit alcohol dehydrogenase family)